MKYETHKPLIFLLLTFLVFGLGVALAGLHGCTRVTTPVTIPTAEPIPATDTTHESDTTASRADGVYNDYLLPCRCGAISVYKPASCPCFDAAVAPDLARALEDLYAYVNQLNAGQIGGKPVGTYDCLDLECGCVLQTYRPGSSNCLEKLYPTLALKLKTVYDEARRREAKSAAAEAKVTPVKLTQASAAASEPHPDRMLFVLGAEWCGPCKRLEREVLPDLDALNPHLVDVDKEKDVAEKLYCPGNHGIPQFVLMDAGDIAPLDWLVGYHDATAVKQFAAQTKIPAAAPAKPAKPATTASKQASPPRPLQKFFQTFRRR